jgi:uncharacterized protein YceK
MKFISIQLAALLFLSGCAGQVISSNPRSVMVKAGAAMAGEAQKTADAECAKHGRYARLSGKNNPIEYVFDCVQ